jgi:hypothetical protein
MRVQPVSAEVADNGGAGEIFKPGEYDFTIYEAVETTSQSSGADMLKLTLHVFNRDGDKRTVFDYILSSQSAQWKARHMMESIGMTKQYEAGDIDPVDIVDRSGRLKLGVAPATAQYPAQNKVQDYVKMKQSSGDPQSAAEPARKSAKVPAGDDLDDSIPF